MPYAYGATIRHEFDTDHLNIWCTFRHPMDQDLKPPLALWLLKEDGNAVDIVASAWQDQFTILLTSDAVVDAPERVLLEYNGPNSNLQTTWGKDWEPWGPILSTDIGKAPCFVDRGDPAAADFQTDDFDIDNAWHELDLSGIVPTGAKAVFFAILCQNADIEKRAMFRKKGNVNLGSLSYVAIQVANIFIGWNIVCPLSDDRRIEYNISADGWEFFDMRIIGWCF